MTNDGQQVPTKRKESISLMCLESLDRVPLKKEVENYNISVCLIYYLFIIRSSINLQVESHGLE